MRGDQLARQWRVIRAIESSSNGLTVAEIAKREETGLRSIYRDLEALQSAGFPLYTEKVDKANRWVFVDTYKFKIPAPFTPLVHRYAGASATVYHVDAYRLRRAADAADLGLDDMLAESSIVLIEWPEKLGEAMPHATHRLTLAYTDDPLLRTVEVA